MASLTTNAGQVEKAYFALASAVPGAVERGTRKVLLAIESKASANLSGQGGPGSYPIPVRSRREWVAGRGEVSTPSGNLRRSLGVRQLGPTSGLVFNRASYAHAVHTSGFHAYGNPAAPFYKPRPFLDDAAKSVRLGDVMRRELARALEVRA